MLGEQGCNTCPRQCMLQREDTEVHVMSAGFTQRCEQNTKLNGLEWQGTAGPGQNGDKSPLAKKEKKKLSKLTGMSFKNVRDKFQRTFTLKPHK